jgi:hypothetical protein
VQHQSPLFAEHLLHSESKATCIVEPVPNQTLGLAHLTKLEVLPHLLAQSAQLKQTDLALSSQQAEYQPPAETATSGQLSLHRQDPDQLEAETFGHTLLRQ